MSGVTLETDGQGHLLHVDQGMISPAECFAGGSEWVAIATGAFMNDEEGVVALAHPAHADRLVACFNACRETPKAVLESGVLATLLTSTERAPMSAISKKLLALLNDARVMLQDLENHWPTRELHKSPEQWREELATALAELSGLSSDKALLDYIGDLQDAAESRPGMGS